MNAVAVAAVPQDTSRFKKFEPFTVRAKPRPPLSALFGESW